MERVEELGINGIKILQDDNLYKFTSDSILLTKFARVKKNDVVADFCSGSGIVGLHLYCLNPTLIKSVTFFEMQTPLYEMSKKSIALNNLEEICSAVNTRVQDIDSSFNGKFSLIVCNPPYMNVGGGLVNPKDALALARHEIACNLDDVVRCARSVLKPCGKLFMVHRADRLCDVITTFRKYGIEPKRLQIVYPSEGKSASLILIEGALGGKPQLRVESAVFMYDKDGNYLQDLRRGLL